MSKLHSNDIDIQLFDTKSRKLQKVSSSDGQTLRIYGCGPTVYRDAHVGNMRTFLLSDIIIRIAKYKGFKVKFIQNITDVGHMSEDFIEDKMLAQAKSESKDPFEIARIYESRFHADLKLLNITPADYYPKASECIELIKVMHILVVIVVFTFQQNLLKSMEQLVVIDLTL